MKKIILFIVFSIYTLNAQVGIGTTTPAGALDLNPTVATNYGLVAPRVALSSILVEAPVVNPQGGAIATGTVVYNTATTGTAPNNVGPGLYYWNGTRWVAFAGSPGGLDWSLIGNGSTVPNAFGSPATNFLGTTDLVDLRIQTNSTERMRFRSDGNVAINNAGNASSKLRVVQATGAALDAVSSTNNDDSTGKGNAFWGVNSNATGIAILGGGGGANIIPTLGAGVSGSHVDGHGIYGSTGNGTPNDNGHNGHHAGGFVLDSDNNPATSNTSAFARIAGKDDVAIPILGAPSRRVLYGGYFSGGTPIGGQSYAYAGLVYNHGNNADGSGGTNYKIVGNGTVSTLIPDHNNIPRVMFCPEAPEVLFEDYGIGKLVNGETYIKIDDILAKSLFVDEEHPLKVFIQLEGDCNGVFVTEKSIDGFKVKELNNGKSNISFSWHLVGNRANTKDETGKITSKFEGLRLPIGPGKLKEPELVEKETRKIN